MNPSCLNPVDCPVSASRRAYRSRVYLRISVDVSEVEPKVTISPAACQVVPGGQAVALEQDHVVLSPSSARWYADRGTDDAAADDDDARLGGNGARWVGFTGMRYISVQIPRRCACAVFKCFPDL